MWLAIIIFAYWLNAVSTVVNKFLLNKKIKNPTVYAFFISVLNLLGIFLAFFGFRFGYSFYEVSLDLISGVTFAFAYLFMFKALAKNEASRITPFMGGWQPLLVLALAMFFLGEKLSFQGFTAFFIILLGTWLIAKQKQNKNTRAGYLFAFISTLLFAISYTLSKYIFLNQDFITAFVWARIGTFIGALVFLIPSVNRRDIKTEISQPKKQTSSLFLFGQICGAVSFVLVNYAISIYQSVAIINALRGLEYVFLLIIVISLAKKFPKILEEKITKKILVQKIAATALIIIGLIMLLV